MQQPAYDGDGAVPSGLRHRHGSAPAQQQQQPRGGIETPAVREITEFIQDTYSTDGMEVMMHGPRSLTVELPAECHDFGSLCAGVEQGWGARVDVNAGTTTGLGPRATIWLPRDQVMSREGASMPSAAGPPGSCCCTLPQFFAVFACCLFVLGLVWIAPAPLAECSDSTWSLFRAALGCPPGAGETGD